MRALSISKVELKVARRLIDRHVFREWMVGDGRITHDRVTRNLKMRWFFGRRRAARKMYRHVREILARRGRFAGRLGATLGELPIVIRRLGIAIKKGGHRDLYTIEEQNAVVVIPRGVVQREFSAFMRKRLEQAPELADYPGLARVILNHLAAEAEELVFLAAKKGNERPDEKGNGLLMGVDEDFRWRLNQTDGHYYYAYTANPDQNLADRRTRRRFKSDIEEVVKGQNARLNELKKSEVVAIVESLTT